MDDSFRAVRDARIGEVVETSTVAIWVESDKLHDLPPLGSLVRVGTATNDTIFAVVSFGQNGGIDATRRAVRRGSNEVSDQAVYERHPELSRLLRTTFEAIPVAVREQEQGRIIQMLPPLPPPLHYSVSRVDLADLCAVTDDPRYLAVLAAHRGEVQAELLIPAHVRTVFVARGRDELWLEQAAREIARIYKRDYDRLLPILDLIDPDR